MGDLIVLGIVIVAFIILMLTRKKKIEYTHRCPCDCPNHPGTCHSKVILNTSRNRLERKDLFSCAKVQDQIDKGLKL